MVHSQSTVIVVPFIFLKYCINKIFDSLFAKFFRCRLSLYLRVFITLILRLASVALFFYRSATIYSWRCPIQRHQMKHNLDFGTQHDDILGSATIVIYSVKLTL